MKSESKTNKKYTKVPTDRIQEVPTRDRDFGNVLTRAAATDACYWLQICMANDVIKSKACLTTINGSITTPQTSKCKFQILDTIIGGRDLIIKHTNNIITCLKNTTTPFNIAANYPLKACQATTSSFVAYSRTMSTKPSTADSAIKIGNVAVPQCLLDVKMGVNQLLSQLADCCTKFET
uniref:Uncharacterized protein n=1 Tax=Romanomermis culicivorax TaxID=13658 RepID=A0A915IXU1_ROMCU